MKRIIFLLLALTYWLWTELRYFPDGWWNEEPLYQGAIAIRSHRTLGASTEQEIRTEGYYLCFYNDDALDALFIGGLMTLLIMIFYPCVYAVWP